MTARSSQPTARFPSKTIATTNATTGVATPIMFPTFCALEMRCCGSAMPVKFDHLVIGPTVLPGEGRCVNRAEIGGDFLVADLGLRAEGVDLPVRRVW